jgi:hypothetical protein
MKRMSALLLGLFVTAGLAGCGSGNVMPNTNTTTPTSPTKEQKGPDIKVPSAGQETPSKR